jgi:DNA-binding GntR family transcriptional regulator
MVLREKVYQVIKERIVNGQYRPGQPLNEKEIIEELQVSRTPFREAINALNEENLVQIFANRGIFVREITAKDLANSFEIRFLLEPYVTRVACLHMPDAVIRNLVERCQNCLAAGYRDMLREDEYYHQTLLQYIDNRQLTKIMRNLYEQNRMQVAMFDAAEKGLISERRQKAAIASVQEHLGILTHIAKRDADGAAQATEAHLIEAQKRAVTYQ